MAQRSRREVWFLVLFTVAAICSAALFVSGAIWVVTACKEGWHHSDWQDISLPVLMLCFLPLVMLGYFKQRVASLLLFCGAAISVLQVLDITRSTGDGLAAALVGAIGFVGLPMALTGVLFRWRSSWDNQPLNPTKILPI